MSASTSTIPSSRVPAEESLCREILEVAARERETCLAQARQEAERLLRAAQEEGHQRTEAALIEARQAAGRQVQNLEATRTLEARQFRARQIELILDSVRRSALEELARRTAPERLDAALGLAQEAAGRLATKHLRLRFSTVDQPLLTKERSDGLRARLAPPVETLEIVFGPELESGGVIAEDLRASQRWDNTPAARLFRNWPEIRRQIAESLGFLNPTHPPTAGS